jgi:hypothetical protein
VADEGLILAFALAVCACACGAPPQQTVLVPAATRPPEIAFPDDPRPLPRYHSKRLALTVPLPDGHAWRIDDHTRPELVATHEPTHSKVVIAVFRADELVGRAQCEALARDRKLVPDGKLRTLEDAVDVTQENYDTRIWVAVEPGWGPTSPLVGHVLAFGGFLRKCYIFHYSTEVGGAADEPVLSARLAYARERILGGMKLDPFAAVSRENPAAGPEVAPPP